MHLATINKLTRNADERSGDWCAHMCLREECAKIGSLRNEVGENSAQTTDRSPGVPTAPFVAEHKSNAPELRFLFGLRPI